MMEMNRGAEERSNEEKGVVKTEVPTKVHWAKIKCENYRFSNLILLSIFSNNILNFFFVLNLALPRFILHSVPY